MELSLPLRLPRSGGGVRRGGGLGAMPALALDALRARRLSARLLVYATLSLALLGGSWMWLRDSSLVSIEHVHIAGVHGPQAIEIRRALDAAASGMSTLHFNSAALRAAVARYPQVAAIEASASFPHSLSIGVRERHAVATLLGPGVRTAVAADGNVLGPALVTGSLPTVAVKASPAPGTQPREASALEAATVLGAAPARLLAYVTRAYDGPEGLTLQMRDGLLVYFGDASRPHAKWLSLARVLASPDAAGALYVDVRLPERPAAGFTQPGSAQASASTLTAAQAGSSDPAAAKLAEQLSREVGGVVSSGESQRESESATSSSSAEAGEAGGAAHGESSESAGAATAESEASTASPTG